jgi:hypothetical protein
MLHCASRVLVERMSLPTGPHLNARLVFVSLLLGIIVLGLPSSALAFQQQVGDDWWRPTQQPNVVPSPSKRPTRVFGVGDSVMLGASGELEKVIPSIEIDAIVGRQASSGIDILRARAAEGDIPDVVIFGLGTNGPLTGAQMAEAMDAMVGVQRVVFVNNSMPRSWQAPNNALLAEAVQRYPNAVLADWHAVTTSVPGLLADDDIHLLPSGARAYAELVSAIALAPLPA